MYVNFQQLVEEKFYATKSFSANVYCEYYSVKGEVSGKGEQKQKLHST